MVGIVDREDLWVRVRKKLFFLCVSNLLYLQLLHQHWFCASV